MGLPAIDYIVIGMYMVIMLAIGFYFSKFMKGGKEFFVGGNLIPWWVGGISLYMTLFSAWTFTGAASFVYNTGWYGILFFATWPTAFLFGFLLSAKKWRRTRVTTPVEYIKSRFNKPTYIFFSILLVLISMYWPSHHLASLAKICAPTMFPNSMTAIDLMIIITGIIILIYSFSGGFWAVCITDVVQFLIFISICVVLIPTCFFSGDIGSFGEFLHKVPALKFTHTIRGNATYTIWYLLGCPLAYIFGYSAGGNAQRYYSVKDEKSARKVGWVAFALFLFAPILFGLPPLIGKVLWPDISMLEYFTNITKADENIFIAVVLKYMPAGMVGIFLSAMMAASMSAMDSAWNAAAAIVSVDIYKNMFNPDADEQKVLKVGRISIFFFSVIAICMALIIIHSDYGVFTFTNIFFGLIGNPISIPLLMGILYRKMSRWSAISSITAGTITAAVTRFCMDMTLGPQYIYTVGVTLLFIVLSERLGRLHIRNRNQARTVNFSIAAGLWIIFMTVNSNPELSLFSDTGTGIFTADFLWVTASCASLLILSHFFTGLYAKDLQSDRSEVEKFFQKMDTPIDVEKEVFVGEAKEVNIFPLVGGISTGLSVLILLLLFSPAARTHIAINLSVSGILLVIGISMLLTKKLEKKV